MKLDDPISRSGAGLRHGRILPITDMDMQLRVLVGICTVLLITAPALAIDGPPQPPPTQTFGSTPQQREKLHHCAAEWTRMKRSGAAAGKLWRDFWPVCEKG